MKRLIKPSYIVATLCALAIAGLMLSMVIPRWQSAAQRSARLKYGTPYLPDNFYEDMASEALEYINNDRKTAGLGELQPDDGALLKAAKTRVKELTVLFDHARPNEESWETAFDQFHVPGRMRGENLASGQSTAATVYNSWWNSPSHKENMMNGDYTYTAIVCMEYEGTYYWVQLFR